MKKFQNVNMIADTADAQKKSPFAIYDGEYVQRYTFRTYSGIMLSDIDRDICRALARYLILTSELLYREFANRGLPYTKEDVQRHLAKLARAGYTQKLSFASATGHFAGKAHILAGRGIGWLNAAMGIRYRLGNYLAGLDVVGLKRLLACNQMLICGRYTDFKVANVALVEPRNERERASIIVRPTAICLNERNEAACFVEAVRRTPSAREDLINKLERILKLYKSRGAHTNIPIAQDLSVVLVAESASHMCELAVLTRKLARKLPIYFTHDQAIYESTDFLYEYCPEEPRGILPSFAACL